MDHDPILKKMSQCIIDGDSELAGQLARQSIDQKIDPMDAINKGFVLGIDYVGGQFGCGEMFLPELVMAGEAMKAAIAILEPEMARMGTERKVLGKVVLATIQGDIHDIGKTLVGTLLSASGFKVFDMGVDVQIGKIIEKARLENVDIIAVSALLTTTMVNQRNLIEALEDIGIREKFKVLVGGAPTTQAWADDIKADGYSEDAVGAIAKAKLLMAT